MGSLINTLLMFCFVFLKAKPENVYNREEPWKSFFWLFSLQMFLL